MKFTMQRLCSVLFLFSSVMSVYVLFVDFVYFESSATAPYQIRRIDELNKTPTGAVEAKVACYYRRRDVSSALINQAEKYYGSDDDYDEECINEITSSKESLKRSNTGITEQQRHQLKHRELFLSRQVECLPATHIRGKCSVTLHNDAEPLTNYLVRDEAFYYKLIYDPNLKTLQEDRGSMRIGSDHQSEIQCLLKSKSEDVRLTEVHEELVWSPSNSLTDQEIDMFCLLAKAVGTYGRAHDTSSSTRQPLLLSAAAAAGRDITRQHAHDILHEANYDLNKAINLLLPGGQPIIYRDQLEDWSANEAHLFEEALDKYSKVFTDILSNCLPWKTHKSIVELYYFWKTTDRYVRRRRTKLAAQEHKLKQVYIPNYSKPNPAVLYHGTDKVSRPCEGCGSLNSSQWYAWGPSNGNSRLCTGCWSYWKHYGGLKNTESKERPTTNQRTQQINSSSIETNSKSGGPINITGSVNHQFKSHSIGLSSGMNTILDDDIDDAYSNDHNNTSATTMVNNTSNTTANSKSLDVSGFFSALIGTPRGTQCFRTPSIIRLARILCPHLVQPLRLARHPGGVPEIFSSKRQLQQQENECSESNLTGMDSLSERNMMLMFTTLKAAAQPIITRLHDPSSLLTRRRTTSRLNDVIDSMASRKGIVFQPLDLSSTLNSLLLNGPIHDRKRPHSPVSLNAPSSKKLDQTEDKGVKNKNISLSPENITPGKCLTNGSSTSVLATCPFIAKSDCSPSSASAVVAARSKKPTSDSCSTDQNLILTSNGISSDDRTPIIPKFESELIQ
ncbi:Metastasis-associated protein MTA1 [Schistosoma japonicum]|nr:Metastasis-associated protein MTA1 [Schistosoma japonicum]